MLKIFVGTSYFSSDAIKFFYWFFFQTLSVEFFHLDELGTSNDEMKEYMISQGYRYHSTVTAKKNHANDYIFVRKDLKTW